jgi:hypothetical protein
MCISFSFDLTGRFLKQGRLLYINHLLPGWVPAGQAEYL